MNLTTSLRTPQQNARLHQLLTRLGVPKSELEQVKGDAAHLVSKGRTTKTSELTEVEMRSVINDFQKALNNQQRQKTPAQIHAENGDEKQRSKVYAIMHSLGWKKNGKLDYEALSSWLMAHTALKKPHLKFYKGKDLNDVVSGLERIESQKNH